MSLHDAATEASNFPRNFPENFQENDTENQYYVIPLFKNCKISILKPLLPLRAGLFLWYGGARILPMYLTVFIKQKGLSLVEYSSVFSVTFIFQFLAAFASGIVADKIGNAKPVLMFHILMSLIAVLSLLLTPKINLCVNTSDINSTEELIKFTNKSINFRKRVLTNFPHANCDEMFDNTNFTSTDVIPLLCTKLKENCTTSNLGGPDNDDTVLPRRNFLFVYIALIIILYSSFSTGYRFMEITVMSFVDKYDVNFGYERLFSMSGDCVITLFTGVILQAFTPIGEENNYETVYWFAVCILYLTLLTVYYITAQIKPKSYNMGKNGLRFLTNKDSVIFLTILVILGSCYSLIENFRLWFLEYINAKPIVFGLLQTLNALYGLPFFYTSRWWLKTFGTRNLFLAAFLGYVIYGIGYSFLYNPWWVLLLEATCILTYHLLWVAVVTHVHDIAPEGLVSTVIAVAGSIHCGIGRSTGTTIGGLTINALGPRTTFRIFAGISFLAAVFYSVYLYCQQSNAIQITKGRAEKHKVKSEETFQKIISIYEFQDV